MFKCAFFAIVTGDFFRNIRGIGQHHKAISFACHIVSKQPNHLQLFLCKRLYSFYYRFRYATAYIITTIVPKLHFLKLNSVSFLDNFQFEKVKDCKRHFVNPNAIMLVLAMLASLVHLNGVNPSAIIS